MLWCLFREHRVLQCFLDWCFPCVFWVLQQFVIAGVQTACGRPEDVNVAQESYSRNVEIGYFNNGTRTATVL